MKPAHPGLSLLQSPRCRFQQLQSTYSNRVYRRAISKIGEKDQAHESIYSQRLQELKNGKCLNYPRIQNDSRTVQCRTFKERYESLASQETKADTQVVIRGRILSSRIAGSKLAFIDIVQDHCVVQVLLNLQRIQSKGVGKDQFKALLALLRKGDIISVAGNPHRTQRGELSVIADELPQLLSPSLQLHPESIKDRELRARNWHVNNLIDKVSSETFRLRSDVIQFLRSFLTKDGFVEVETPILSGTAGGAAATPFKTRASEFPDWDMSLRIAPELWLKRIIVSGMDRVFEIGPSFRNEGLDRSHNPEFTTCEFYQSFASLEDLLELTERLLFTLDSHVESLKQSRYQSLPKTNVKFTTPFRRLSFILALEEAVGQKLPNLSNSSAIETLCDIVVSQGMELPKSPTLPLLLDSLSSHLIEPKLEDPTFLIHHPAVMSPLAKSFLDPSTGQDVAARAELFVGGRELVNAYEEENSPISQHIKLTAQISESTDRLTKDFQPKDIAVDENYCNVLEWGMPPTGGWGCGLDRLVMLFSGAKRIGHVRAFGSLRNIVGLSREGGK